MIEFEKKKSEKAVLIGVSEKRDEESVLLEHLKELEFLADTLKINTVKTFSQKVDNPDPRTFVGKGKLEEIESFIKIHEVDTAIFDEELTPSQLRNLEKFLKCKIYDRSLLILDIFLQRARTSQAKLQVELARYQYLLPRLTRMWTHLERQRGGTGTRGGAGEKEIETDKRIINDKISLLKKRLDKVDKQSQTRRKSRDKIVRVALVGYTNVGKSTIMKILSKSDAFAENKLFATVDSLVRKVVINQIPFLLTDTVGFIRKLPHSLIESFKSTLDEVREADILVHVADISNPNHEDHIKTVNDTLEEIGASSKPTLMVYNKIDLIEQESDELEISDKKEAMKSNMDRVFVSALNKTQMDLLRKALFEKVKKRHLTIFPNYLSPVYSTDF
ncbi:MAG: GTPase HflX [Bacteroidota bacterium]